MLERICLINNFNYSKYLRQCLDSVFHQTTPFDRVIIVDDGSTDNSAEIIRSYQSQHRNLTPIFKENGGQLSTLNAAVNLVSQNSQIFLLDADDIYPPDYLQLIIEKCNNQHHDFTYCIEKFFANEEIATITTACAGDRKNEVFPKSSALARGLRRWIGNATTCITISGALFKELLSYPVQDDFRIRADDALIFSSSIVGAKKIFFPSLQIGYRTHVNNSYHNARLSADKIRSHDAAVERLFSWYCAKYSLNIRPSLAEVLAEYETLDGEQKKYLRMPNRFRLYRKFFRYRLRSYSSGN